MTFLVFEVINTPKPHLCVTGAEFQLAGRNLLFDAWERRHRPINAGWDVSADELISDTTGGTESYATRRLIIDCDPNSPTKVSLTEILHIYAFIYGNNGSAEWTPLMLKLRDVYYDDDCSSMDATKRTTLYQNLKIPADSPAIMEFLYLHGDDKGWRFGRNGMTNAVFLHPQTRDFFRPYF